MPWSWIVVKDTGLYQYLQHKRNPSKRKIFQIYHNRKEPVDWQWVETGVFKTIKRPPPPPSRKLKREKSDKMFEHIKNKLHLAGIDIPDEEIEKLETHALRYSMTMNQEVDDFIEVCINLARAGNMDYAENFEKEND